MEGYIKKVKIYVKPTEWYAYVSAVDEYGNAITCTANKETMDPVIYDIGWKAYRDECIECGEEVEIIKLDK